MMMQMLSAGGMDVLSDGLREADSDNEKGYFEFEPVKATKRDASWVSLAAGKAVKVIYTFLEELPAEFEYRIIFMRRNLREVVRSQQAMLQRRGERGAGLELEQLVGVFERQLEKTDLWISRQENVRRLNVDYDRVLGDPKSLAQEVTQFLKIPLNTSAMAEVVDASLHHQQGG